MRSIAHTLVTAGILAVVAGAAPLAAQEGGLSIEAAIAQDVMDRMPVDTGTTFSADVGKLWCWSRVTGADPGTTIQHVWIRGSDEMAVVNLTVGGSPWRTYSSKNIEPSWTGEWRVEIRDGMGNVLATRSFRVGAGM